MVGLTEGGAGVVRGTVLSNTAPAPDYLLPAATPRRSLAAAGRTPAAVPHAGSPPRLRALPVPRNSVNNAWHGGNMSHVCVNSSSLSICFDFIIDTRNDLSSSYFA